MPKPSFAWPSLRYARGEWDARSMVLRALGKAQRRETILLKSDPRLCAAVLAASDTKGQFVETLIATPAWQPIYSIESVDGALWKQLSTDFRAVLSRMQWRERLPGLIEQHVAALEAGFRSHPSRVLDSPTLARLVVNIFFELVFEAPMSAEDETLFYEASLAWRMEIAVKSPGDKGLKHRFWTRLHALVEQSSFRDGLETYTADPACWLSVFAQPLLLSPMINIGDIFVAVFGFLEADSKLYAQARDWAQHGDRARLEGILLESIRLQHPFPVLERELKADLCAEGRTLKAGTQVFVQLDQFEQDLRFDPERWMQPARENPYQAIPFAAGPRMCIGKPVAMELMHGLLVACLLRFPSACVQPARGHRYSGRANDGEAVAGETRYQLRTFAHALLRSLSIGRERARRGVPRA